MDNRRGPLPMTLQTNHAMLAHNSIVNDAGRQIESVSGMEGELLPGPGQTESYVAPDYINHFMVGVIMVRIDISGVV